MNILYGFLRIVLILSVLGFGYLGFCHYQSEICEDSTSGSEPHKKEKPVIFDDQPIFKSFKLLTLGAGETEHHDNNYLFCARLLALIVARDIIATFYAELVREVKLHFIYRHTVIIGPGRIGTEVALDKLKRSEDCYNISNWFSLRAWQDYFFSGTVIIESKSDNPTINQISRLGGIIL